MSFVRPPYLPIMVSSREWSSVGSKATHTLVCTGRETFSCMAKEKWPDNYPSISRYGKKYSELRLNLKVQIVILMKRTISRTSAAPWSANHGGRLARNRTV